jgi:hypothetical protein
VGHDEIAAFFRQVTEEDSSRAYQCHAFARALGSTDNTGPEESAE